MPQQECASSMFITFLCAWIWTCGKGGGPKRRDCPSVNVRAGRLPSGVNPRRWLRSLISQRDQPARALQKTEQKPKQNGFESNIFYHDSRPPPKLSRRALARVTSLLQALTHSLFLRACVRYVLAILELSSQYARPSTSFANSAQ